MCGFTGYYSTIKRHLVSEVESSLESIANRGPDDSGVNFIDTSNGVVCLGHRRLSIIDLSADGHQPFFDEQKHFAILYNGELYNYIELRQELELLGVNFRTNTDTEVVLNAWKTWGHNCMIKFNGMFSIVVVDFKMEKMFLIRDAFGIKPLFYSFFDNNIYFASEVTALLKYLKSPPQINLQKSIDYLLFNIHDNDESTFFDNIFSILPGHFLKIDLFNFSNNFESVKWWTPRIIESSNLNFKDASECLRDIFLRNVQLNMRSDVIVGAALSGGIDSSAIVCCMRKVEPTIPIHTFTYVANSQKINEEKWADLVNLKVNSQAHKVSICQTEFLDDISDLIKTQGEPFSGTSIYAQYQIFKEAKKVGVKVTLDGQGADEMLGGYLGYPEYRIESLLNIGSFSGAFNFTKLWSRHTNQNVIEPWKQLLKNKVINNNKISKSTLIRNYFTPDWVDLDYLKKQNVNVFYKSQKNVIESSDRKLVQQLVSDLTLNRIPRLLRYADRNSMRFSVESRVPFLSIELSNFLHSLPESYLVSDSGESKSLFRNAMRGIVPDEILDRKDKIGFNTPENELISNLLIKTIDKLNNTINIPFINKDKLLKNLKSNIIHKKTVESIEWRLYNLVEWIRLFEVQFK
jgi:asparagine synthase (glutamine-hydrolysing)